MKGLTSCAVLLAGALATAPSAFAQPTCPAAGSATGCNSTIIINPDGSLTIAGNSSTAPYDGSDDNLVGILNSSGHTVNSIHLSGAGNGGGLFAFDGDGIDFYVGIPNNPSDPSGYGGPLSFFTNITATNTFADTGDVNFIGGLADGASTYFSLESSAGTTPIFTSTPEPSTFVLLGTGALVVAGSVRRRFTKR